MSRIIDGEQKNMVGAQVRKFRLEQKLSQQQLSDKLETIAVYVCRGSISRIEDMTRTVSDIELYGLSKILNKPIESFFERG
ncbi:MAG: helix-turn-helix transcriptional regulator [Oscillospiraceae bacterium]|nr:helix-turn-helix transcriptional regulator [Oscillospiraceae bacterium]